MLIRITNKCKMGCSHCCVDATPEGEHMSRKTFEQALELTKSMGVPVVLISGGEPTEHPELLEFTKLAKALPAMVLLLSNGQFFEEKKYSPEELQVLLETVDGVQVTNDPRYYPHAVTIPTHPKVTLTTELLTLSPIGRAKDMESLRKAPHCFNIRSATKTALGIAEASLGLAVQTAAFCSPSVNIDGTVVAGETPFCYPIGKVGESLLTLTHNILHMQCNKCGMFDALPQHYKVAVGEAKIIIPGV
jgi:hypothetical protein